jgi:transcriptional regulator with XRE-family HTH domain
MKRRKLNVVGATLRRLRLEKGLTQPQLAAKLSILGWDVSAGTVAKVETHLRSVYDAELFVYARALRVPLASLYPAEVKSADLRECLYKPVRR